MNPKNIFAKLLYAIYAAYCREGVQNIRLSTQSLALSNEGVVALLIFTNVDIICF